MNVFMGVQIVVSQHATELVTNWPVRARSKRLQKKMLKKRGPQFTTKPTAYRMADGRMVVHPDIYAALKKNAQENART